MRILIGLVPALACGAMMVFCARMMIGRRESPSRADSQADPQRDAPTDRRTPDEASRGLAKADETAEPRSRG
jgi:hypothetical protein